MDESKEYGTDRQGVEGSIGKMGKTAGRILRSGIFGIFGN